MSDFGRIEAHIRHAHLARSAALGELIATGIVAACNGISGFAATIAATARAKARPAARERPLMIGRAAGRRARSS